MNIKSPIYVSSPDKIPSVEHWAIIEGTSVTIPGDERSRQCPGHGYPESTESYITYEAYLDKAEFEGALEEKMRSIYHRSVCGIHVLPVKVSTKYEFTEPK